MLSEGLLAPFGAAALPPHALSWSGVDGLSQPGAADLPEVPVATAPKGSKTKDDTSLPLLRMMATAYDLMIPMPSVV